MAEAQVIGKVAVKVFPNTKTFKKDLEKQLKKIEKKLKPVNVKVEFNEAKVEADAKALQKKVQAALGKATIGVDFRDPGSIEAGIAKIQAALSKLREVPIELDLKNREQLQEELAKLTEARFINLEVNTSDTGSIQAAINRINTELAKIRAIEIPVGLNEADLLAELANLEAMLPESEEIDLRLKLYVDPSSMSSLEAAIKQVEAELAKTNQIEIPVDLDRDSLLNLHDRLSQELADIATVEITIDHGDLSSVKRAIARIDAELEKVFSRTISLKADPDSLKQMRDDLQAQLDQVEMTQKLEIDAQVNLDRQKLQLLVDRVNDALSDITWAPSVDEAKLEKTMAEIESTLIRIEELDASITVDMDPLSKRKVELEILALKRRLESLKADINPTVDKEKLAVAEGLLKLLTRTRDVVIKPVIDNAAFRRSMRFLGQLSGGRILFDKFDVFVNFMNNFDKYAPKIAQFGLGIAGLGAAAISSVANMLSLAGSITTVAMAAIPLPGILGGMIVGLGASVIALKDFKNQIPQVTGLWTEMQNVIKRNFWDVARKPIAEMVNTLFPAFTRELKATSTALGGFFGSFARELTQKLGPALGGMFASLNESIKIATNSTGAVANIIKVLGQFGASYLPRLAQWFVDVTDKFNQFLTKAYEDGSLKRWADAGIQALADLGTVLWQIIRIFGGLISAAQEAGGSVLSSLADGLKKVADIVNSPLFHDSLVGVFKSAFAAMHSIATIAGPAVAGFFQQLAVLLNAILPMVGTAIGTLVRDIAKALSTPELTRGFTALFAGITRGVQALTPIWVPLAKAIGMLGEPLGLLIDLMAQLLTSGLKSLLPTMEAIMPSITKLIKVLGDGLLTVMEALEPVWEDVADAFAEFLSSGVVPAVTKAVDALVPVLVDLAPILGDVATTILEGLTPVLPILAKCFEDVMEKLGPLLPKLIEDLAPILPVLAEAIVDIVGAVAPLLPKLAELLENLEPLVPAMVSLAIFALPLVVGAIKAVAGVIGFVIDVINWLADVITWIVEKVQEVSDKINDFLDGVSKKGEEFRAWLSEMWPKLWAGIQQYFSMKIEEIKRIWNGALDGIGFYLSSKLDGIKRAWNGAWDAVGAYLSMKWNSIKESCSTALSSVTGFFSGLPGKITGALGDLGQLLVKAGKSVIDGFVNGIKDKFGAVKDTLGDLTDKLFGWKGPPERDRVILFDAGQLVIDGFVRGLESRYDVVRKSLRGLTDDVAGTDMGAINVPGMSTRLNQLAGQANNGGPAAQRILNYYAAPGSSISSEEDLFTAAGRSRMGAF